MGIGSFLKGVGAAIIPGGKSYGDYNPPKKKKKDEGITAPRQISSTQNPGNAAQLQKDRLQAARPENLFAGLNQNLQAPGAPKNVTTPGKNVDLSPLVKPQPGQVIKPTTTLVPKAPVNQPKEGYVAPAGVQGTRATVNGQTGVMATNKVTGKPHFVPDAPKPQDNSFFGKVKRNIGVARDTAVGTVANIPEVALGAARAGTGLVQGAAHLPSLATHGLTYVPRRIAGNDSGVNRVLSGVNRGVDRATSVVDKPFDVVNRGLDRAAQGYENAVPAAAGGAEAYRATQIPLNVLAGLLTLGGSAAPEAGASAGRLSKLTQLFNRPLTSNADNIVSRTAQQVTNRSAPVVQAVNNPFKTTQNAVNRLLGNNRNVAPLERDVVDAGEAGNIMNGVEDLTRPPTQIQVQQPTNIPITSADDIGSNIPVTNNTPVGAPIRELGGDTPGAVRVPTQEEVAAQRAKTAFDNQAPVRPDARIEGVGKPVLQRELDDARATIDDNLKTGKISEDQHAELTKQLEDIKPNDAPAPKGQKIEVKQVDSIPVQNKTDVPQGLPETPGTVRATESTAPNQAASEIAAQAPAPITIPKVGSTLPDGTTVTKRMVAAARNQAKLAKQKAKADEATAEALTRSTSAKPTGDRGHVPTGELRKGRNGNVTESASRKLEAARGQHDTANLSVDDVLSKAKNDIVEQGVHSPDTVRELKALRDSGKYARTSPEFKAISDEYNNAISNHARSLSMTDRTARTTASGEQLANRFTNKLISFAEDSGKLTDDHISQINKAETAFTEARDAATKAGDDFKASGSDADFAKWKAAQDAAEKADRDAKITEFLVSKDVLKGNKSLEASKAIQEAEKNAGVYSMDSIDANMLSGTGTMVRNYVNTLFPRIENKLFGRLSTRAVKPIATVGGSSSRGAKIGEDIGKKMYKADIAARKEAGVGFIRRTVTAGNTVGERNIQATAYSKAFDHYKQLLKDEGYKGKELDNRVEYNVRTDPDGLVAGYERDALQANALSSLTHTKKIENVLADGVQKAIANAGIGSKGQQAGRFAAKAVTRVGVGFPTVIAKSLVEGLKRATLGIPEAGWSTVKYMNTGNKDAWAAELAKSMQHAGSGASMILLGNQLGKMGVVSGAYPSDPAERERWQAEGRQENSIKIAGQWFNIPGYLGGFAVPLMLGATTAGGDIKDEASLKNVWDTILSASPVDSLQSTLDIMTGNSSDSKIKNAVTSLARAATPAGSFVAELAKLTDSTQNDTSTKDTLHNILDSIAAGIPGLNNAVNKTDKTDAYGNVLHNPNKAAIVLGAQGSEQNAGKSSVQDAQGGADDTVKQLADAGVISNKNLMQLVDPKLAKKISDNQSLTPEEVTKVQKSVTKGVSATDDNNWRENGDYSTDKAALKAKLQLLETDPTAKKSEKDMLKVQMARDDVLEQNKIPYEDLKLYQSTDLTDWRNMGNPESDEYDPDMYQRLFEIDDALTKAGGSYKKGSLTKNKFTAKEAGKGKGGSKVDYGADFGTLKAGTGAPSVKQYQSIDSVSGNVPQIQVVRPNIVHKIGSSG